MPRNSERLRKILDELERIAQQITQVDDPGAAMFAQMRIWMKGLYRDFEELFEIVNDLFGEDEGMVAPITMKSGCEQVNVVAWRSLLQLANLYFLGC